MPNASQMKITDTGKNPTSHHHRNNQHHTHNRMNYLLLIRIIVELLCFAVTGTAMLLIEHFVTPTISGFYCSDVHLTHPVKPVALGDSSVLFVGALVPFVLIFLTELVMEHVSEKPRKPGSWLFYVYLFAGNYFFSLLIVLFITDVIKYSFGTLSPTFFTVCKPDVNCSVSENQFKLIYNYTCLGKDTKTINQARLSFPSEHASMLAHGISFMVVYMETKFCWKGAFMVKKLFQGALISIGVFLSSLQISDNSHHKSDIVAGVTLGSIFGYITCLTIHNSVDSTES